MPTPSTQFVITAAQAFSLMEAIQNYDDGESAVVLTRQGDGDLLVGFSMTLINITPEGEAEER